MKTVYVVSGANGFLGSHIAGQLLQQKQKVVGLIHKSNKWSEINQNEPNLTLEQVDITDFNQLDSVMAGIARRAKSIIFIHCAGVVSIDDRANPLVEKVNVGGSQNVIKACQKHRVQRLVYISSVHAIAEKPHVESIGETNEFNPNLVVGTYAKTKAEATKNMILARKDGLDVVIIHPSGIIGPGDYSNSHLKQVLLDYINRRLPAIVEGGYDFVDVRDVASASISAAQKIAAKNQNYIISNRYFTIERLLELIGEIEPNYRRKIRKINFGLAYFLAGLFGICSALHKKPATFTRYALYTLGSNTNLSHAKASQELGYQPRQIKETLADTIDWYRAQKLI